MKPLILLNWKMNPETQQQAKTLLRATERAALKSGAEVVVFPPSVFIGAFPAKKKNAVVIGAQNCAPEENEGRLTGEISPKMLKSMGVRYVLVGHSERRYRLGEREEIIRDKVSFIQKNGMVPVLCVGEKKKTSVGKAKQFVIRQLFADLKNSDPRREMVIAYEPVWAIGGDKEVDVAHAGMMIEEIQQVLKRRVGKRIRVVYGGSVSPNVAGDFLRHTTAQGLLVGSASLDPVAVGRVAREVG